MWDGVTDIASRIERADAAPIVDERPIGDAIPHAGSAHQLPRLLQGPGVRGEPRQGAVPGLQSRQVPVEQRQLERAASVEGASAQRYDGMAIVLLACVLTASCVYVSFSWCCICSAPTSRSSARSSRICTACARSASSLSLTTF